MISLLRGVENFTVTLIVLLSFLLAGCAPPRVGFYNPGIGPGGGVAITMQESNPPPVHTEVEVPAEEVPVQDPSPTADGTLPIPSPDGRLPGTVTTVRRGELAPFSGTLLSPEAAARLTAKLELADDRTAAEVKRAVDEKSAEYDLQLRERAIELDAEKKKREVQVRLRDDHISDLNEQLAKEKDDMVWLWVGGGALGGALITILGVVAAGQIAK